jgi:glycosyltransferase involved in cell wall biosynthesis
MYHPQMALRERGIETFIGEIGWSDTEGFVAVPPIARLFSGTRGVIKNYQQHDGNLDIVVIKLFMNKETCEYIDKAKALGQTVIIDTDDHFENLPSDNLAFRTTDPKLNPDNNRNFLIKSYSHANGIIASTKFLYDKMTKFNRNVYLVPNSLFPEHFIRRIDFAGEKPVIGWVGMMLWRTEDIRDMAGILKPFIEKHDLTIHHSGSVLDNPNWFAEVIGIDPQRLTTYRPSRPKYYANILMAIDIGIVPLTNNTFNQAKSYLKGLEYAFCQIPFVATATDEYKKLANDGVGRVAAKPSEWTKHLEALLDPEVRKAEAKKSYDIVYEKHNIRNVAQNWIDAIMAIHETNTNKRG